MDADRWYAFYRPVIFGLIGWEEVTDPHGPTLEEFARLNLMIDEYLENESEQSLLKTLIEQIQEFMKGLS